MPPFDEEDPKEFVPKTGLKKVSGQKSMFDDKPRPPTPQEFQQKVQEAQDKISGYNKRAAELFMQFSKNMADKTLAQNRNIFNNETEKEMLLNMVELARDLNNDPNEPKDSEGSLMLLICLLKTSLSQRDRINELEYTLTRMQQNLTDFVSKEVNKILDIKKTSG